MTNTGNVPGAEVAQLVSPAFAPRQCRYSMTDELLTLAVRLVPAFRKGSAAEKPQRLREGVPGRGAISDSDIPARESFLFEEPSSSLVCHRLTSVEEERPLCLGRKEAVVAGTHGRVHLPRRHQFQRSAAGEPPGRGRNQVGAEPMCLYWVSSTLCHSMSTT